MYHTCTGSWRIWCCYLLICNSSRQAILLNCMMLHKLTMRIHIGTKLVLCRHTYTRTCTMYYCIFSFSLPVGLLAGQVEGGLQTIMVSRVPINGVG